MDNIKLVIDGQTVEVAKGTTVLRAAQTAGIYIPTLCDDPDLEPYGGCRLCVVEIENMRGLPTACTTQATAGMVVHSDTPAVNDARRTVVDLLISDHPTDCLTCLKNNRCDLQKVAAYLGIKERRYARIEKQLPVDTSNPFFKLDRNYCILCGKCVRTCDEVSLVNAIEIVSRGYPSHVSPFGDKMITQSNCISCGECVTRCPTAALVPTERISPQHEVKSVCPYCGVGCGILLGTRGGAVVSVRGDRESPVNNGRLCVKGRFGIIDFVNHPSRLKTPLIKKNGEFVESSWEEAIDLISSKLTLYRKNQFAAISSAKCPNEDNYVFQKFTRTVMGTNNIDHCARLCHSPSVTGLNTSFGSGAMTNSINEIKDAGCIFTIGSNTTDTHPIIGFEVKKAIRRGAKLIVANPLEIELCQFADVWLRHLPGSDVALLMGMMRVIVDEHLLDEAFIQQRCENFEAFRESLKVFTPEFVEQTTHVPWEQIVKAARIYATNKPSSILYAMGITQHAHGTDNVMATANLAMLTGNVGKLSSGVNPLRGQNNVQGACDMGALPNVFPGYQNVANAAAAAKFESSWGYTLDRKPGLTLTEMFDAAFRREIKALYIIGENPVLSEPSSKHVEEALDALDFLVVQDIFLTETARFADVVLPAASFAERDGTFTNTERRVQRIHKASDPLGKSQPDWLTICQVARKMGAAGFDYKSPFEIMDEIAILTPSFGGISYERLEKAGLQWPCPTREHSGTPTLHLQQFNTASGKGKFVPLIFHPPHEMPDSNYPLILTTRRSPYQYHTGTMTRKVNGLNVLRPEELVEINPGDASYLGIIDGEPVRVTSRRGTVTAAAKVTETLPRGVVSMTFHFVESRTNLLTSPALDPAAKMPELKVCTVKVEKIKAGVQLSR